MNVRVCVQIQVPTEKEGHAPADTHMSLLGAQWRGQGQEGFLGAQWQAFDKNLKKGSQATLRVMGDR